MCNLSGNLWEIILPATQALHNNRCTQSSLPIFVEFNSDNWKKSSSQCIFHQPPQDFISFLFIAPTCELSGPPVTAFLAGIFMRHFCSSLIQCHCECPSILARQGLLGRETSQQQEKQGLGVREWQHSPNWLQTVSSHLCWHTGRWCSPAVFLFHERWGLTWASILFAYNLEKFSCKIKDGT